MADAEEERGRVLVVDDDASVCWALEQAVKAEGYAATVAADAAAARRALARSRPDVVITDVRMPGESGLDLLRHLREAHPELPVIVMTAYGTMETAVEAVRAGAFDYLAKPLDLDRVGELLRRAMGEDRLAAIGRPEGADGEPVSAIVGQTPAMQEVYRRLAAAAASEVGVLITGPSGSGKELVARAVHRHGPRGEGPFIAVNCGALPDNLVESELFGHEAGAFTDAKQRKIGRIEAANGGTLFLDEIGELPPAAQVKLLRFLEDQRFVRVGGEQEIQVDVRIIAATNQDLAAAVRTGSFREDLGYRLQVLRIHLPSLSRRLDDLPALVRHFLSRIGARLGHEVALTDEAMSVLRAYTWPGNVRELKHVLEEAAVLASGGIIAAEHLRIRPDPAAVTGGGDFASAVQNEVARLANQCPGEVSARLTDLVEAPMIREALARTAGNQLRAAELLGINRITLKKRMDQLGISKG